jgi:hypothetical protein
MPLDVGPISAQSREFAPILAGIAMGAVERERDGLSASGAFDLVRRCRLGALRLQSQVGFRELMSVIIGLGNADAAIALVLVDHFLFVECCLRRCRGADGAMWRRSVLDGALFRLVDLGAEAGVDAVPTPDGRFYRVAGFTAAGIERNTDFLAVCVRLPDHSRAWAIVPNGHAEGCENGLLVPNRNLIEDGDGVLPEQYAGPVLRQLMLAAVSAGILRAIRRDTAHVALLRGGTVSGRLSQKTAAQLAADIAADAEAGEASVLAAADALECLAASRPTGPIAPSAGLAAALHAEEARGVVDRLTRRSARRLVDLCKAAGGLAELVPERHERHARALFPRSPAQDGSGEIGVPVPPEPSGVVLLAAL